MTDKKRHMDSTKLLWHMDRVIQHYDKGEKVAPIHIDVGLTKDCNMRCDYCYGYFQSMDGAIIQPDALINNLILSAAKIGVRSLGFIGDGEPTLNPAWALALEVGKREGLSLAISTNGILVDTEDKREIILRCCEWARFNMSAYSAQGYEDIHRSNKRNIIMDNLKALVRLKRELDSTCDLGIQMVFVPDLMMDEVIPLAQFAIDTGVDYMVIKQCSLPDEGESGMAQFDLDQYSEEATLDLLERAEAMSTPETDIVVKWNTLEAKGKRNYDHCVGVQLLPEISGDGGIYPCGYFFGGKRPDLCYGNLHDNTLEEIVFSDRYWNIVNHMNEKFDPHTQCKGCCREDMVNTFVWDYLHKPKGVNFI